MKDPVSVEKAAAGSFFVLLTGKEQIMSRMCRDGPQNEVLMEGQIGLKKKRLDGKERSHGRASIPVKKRSLLARYIRRMCGPGRKRREPIHGQVTMEMVNIVNVRNEKGYTQEKMARLAHVDRSTFASYETGRRPVPRDVLDAVENAKERWTVKYGNDGKSPAR